MQSTMCKICEIVPQGKMKLKKIGLKAGVIRPQCVTFKNKFGYHGAGRGGKIRNARNGMPFFCDE